MSRTHNREYFYNNETKESAWEPPIGTDLAKLQPYLESKLHEPEKVKCSHILVKHLGSRRPRSWKNENITISKEDAIAIVKKFRDEIKSGGRTFAEIATAESDCSSHSQGGDLGFFGRGQMQPSFEALAFLLQVGEMSDIVESDSGVHIILRTA